MSEEILPPLFNIFTGLSFATILFIRFVAPQALKPIWGRIIAFSLIFVALGNLLLSFATARSLSSGATMFALAGASFFVAAVLVVAGLFIAARRAAGVETP